VTDVSGRYGRVLEACADIKLLLSWFLAGVTFTAVRRSLHKQVTETHRYKFDVENMNYEIMISQHV